MTMMPVSADIGVLGGVTGDIYQSQREEVNPGSTVSFHIFRNQSEYEEGYYAYHGQPVFGSDIQVVPYGSIIEVHFETTGILPEDTLVTWMGVKGVRSRGYQYQFNSRLWDYLPEDIVVPNDFTPEGIEDVTDLVQDKLEDWQIEDMNKSSIFYIDLSQEYQPGEIWITFGVTHKGSKEKIQFLIFFSTTKDVEGKDSTVYKVSVGEEAYGWKFNEGPVPSIEVPVEMVGDGTYTFDVYRMVCDGIYYFDWLKDNQTIRLNGNPFKVIVGEGEKCQVNFPDYPDQSREIIGSLEIPVKVGESLNVEIIYKGLTKKVTLKN